MRLDVSRSVVRVNTELCHFATEPVRHFLSRRKPVLTVLAVALALSALALPACGRVAPSSSSGPSGVTGTSMISGGPLTRGTTGTASPKPFAGTIAVYKADGSGSSRR